MDVEGVDSCDATGNTDPTLLEKPERAGYVYRWCSSARLSDELLTERAGVLKRHARRLPDAGRNLRGPLTAVAMFAESVLANTRPSTLAGLVLAIGADARDPKAIDDLGHPARGTTLRQFDDFLAAVAATGFRRPLDQVCDKWLETSERDAITAALLDVLGSAAAVGTSGSSSCLNFFVPRQEPTGRDLPSVLANLGDLPGLDGPKALFSRFAAAERVGAIRREAGLSTGRASRHMMFLGNPGTGKTTVARMVAEILDATGALPGAHLVEADRSMLVGEFVGTSAQKTRKVVEEALGGVLFIDEAYSLAGTRHEHADLFAHEAMATLVKLMEDHRDDLVVILAGYPGPMAGLAETNPGLASRIGLTVTFPDYTDEEAVAIFSSMAAERDFELAPHASEPLRAALPAARVTGFGNARWVRQTLDAAVDAHAQRIVRLIGEGADHTEELTMLRLSDVAEGLSLAGGG